MSQSIPISSLNDLSSVKIEDFVAIVQSSSITTYRTPLSSLISLMGNSGSVISSSWSSASISASYSIQSDSASYLFPNILYRTTASNAISSSYSFSSSYAISSSHAIIADSSSYLFPNILYRTTASNAISASWANTSSWAINGLITASTYPITSSWAISASWAPVPPSIATGIIVSYPSSSAPVGWLVCDGGIFNPVTYPALASLIGKNYGPAVTGKYFIRSETPNIYGNNDDGIIRIMIENGEGVYSVTSASATQYINNGGTASYTGLDGGTIIGDLKPYPFTITELSRNPITSSNITLYVPYGPSGGETTLTPFTFSLSEYRTPDLASYYQINVYPLVNPLIYMIKT